MKSSEIPPDWLIIETVANLQRYARNEYNPTQAMIHKTMEEAQGTGYDYDALDERMRALESQEVLLRTAGSYYASVRWRIHPSYVPEDPIRDPYTPEERELLLDVLEEAKATSEEIARERAERKKAQARRRSAKNRTMRARERRRAEIGRQDLDGLMQLDDLDSVTVAAMIEEDPSDVFVLDTETTGLHHDEDDVLELAIINGAGRTVYNRRFSAWKWEWDEAYRVHHIAPEDVEGLPRLEDEAATISGLLRRARVLVGYSVWFDLEFLADAGVRFPKVPQCDVMEEFAEVYGEWEPWAGNGNGGWVWQKLVTAGRHYNIDTEGAHGALRDCQITLGVLKAISKEPESVRHRKEIPKDRGEASGDARKGRGLRVRESIRRGRRGRPRDSMSVNAE